MDDSKPGNQFFHLTGSFNCLKTVSAGAAILMALDILIFDGIKREIPVTSKKRKRPLKKNNLNIFTII
jgi:hypothetical protein